VNVDSDDKPASFVVNQRGCRVYRNGDVYVGGFNKKGELDDRGLFVRVDGLTYHGEYSNGKKHGHGILTLREAPPGHGVMTYDGNFEYGKRAGWGRMTFANCAIYEGNWKDDRRHGPGVQKDPTGEVIHAGSWIKGCFHFSFAVPPKNLFF